MIPKEATTSETILISGEIHERACKLAQNIACRFVQQHGRVMSNEEQEALVDRIMKKSLDWQKRCPKKIPQKIGQKKKPGVCE